MIQHPVSDPPEPDHAVLAGIHRRDSVFHHQVTEQNILLTNPVPIHDYTDRNFPAYFFNELLQLGRYLLVILHTQDEHPVEVVLPYPVSHFLGLIELVVNDQTLGLFQVAEEIGIRRVHQQGSLGDTPFQPLDLILLESVQNPHSSSP